MRPAALTPRKLTNTTTQIAPSVSITITGRTRKEREEILTRPRKRRAMTGSEVQIEIQ